jgi:hypothetical protein
MMGLKACLMWDHVAGGLRAQRPLFELKEAIV